MPTVPGGCHRRGLWEGVARGAGSGGASRGGGLWTFEARPPGGGGGGRRGARAANGGGQRSGRATPPPGAPPARPAETGGAAAPSGFGVAARQGAPRRRIQRWPFPRPVSRAPAATCSVLGDESPAPFGRFSGAAAHSVQAPPRDCEAGRPGSRRGDPGSAHGYVRRPSTPGVRLPRKKEVRGARCQGRGSPGRRRLLLGGFPNTRPDSALDAAVYPPPPPPPPGDVCGKERLNPRVLLAALLTQGCEWGLGAPPRG